MKRSRFAGKINKKEKGKREIRKFHGKGRQAILTAAQGFFAVIAVAVILGTAAVVGMEPCGNRREKAPGFAVTADGYCKIYDAEDFVRFMETCSCPESGALRGRLMRDIYLNDPADLSRWLLQPPERQMGDRTGFYGTLDGNGYAVCGIYSAYGYGLVWRNEGIIRNLNIKDSLVSGRADVGGICGYNYGKIEQCSFQGILACGPETEARMAGICVENMEGGEISLCRYMGEMRTGTEDQKSQMAGIRLAGICRVNEGKVADCSNLAQNTSGMAGYAITDCMAENCYAGKDMGWEAGSGNECLELGKDRLIYAPFYMRGDWYGLYVAQQRMKGRLVYDWEKHAVREAGRGLTLPQAGNWLQETENVRKEREEEEKERAVMEKTGDAWIVYLLQKILFFRNVDISALSFSEGEAEGEALFVLRISDGTGGEEMTVAKYPMEETVYKDSGRLWQSCAACLPEGAQGQWEHRTWKLSQRPVIPQELAEKVIFYRYGGQDGMFYVLPDAAYRITFGGEFYGENTLWEIAEGICDRGTFWQTEKSPDGMDGGGALAHIWEIPLLAFDRDFSLTGCFPEEWFYLEDREKAEWDKDPVVGTWKTFTYKKHSSLQNWVADYYTCFSPDGRVVHYGHRNVDVGRWERTDENTVTAVFDDCIYMGIGGKEYPLPEYRVTYLFDSDHSLCRSTDRKEYFSVSVEEDGETVLYEATDYDDYGEPLEFENGECEIREKYYAFDTADFPDGGEFPPKLDKRLAEIAPELAEGKEAELEQIDLPYRLEQVGFYDITGDGEEEMFVSVSMLPKYHGYLPDATYILSKNRQGIYTVLTKNTTIAYTELVAPDGTVLLEESIYRGASSWKGGTRLHLGYRDSEVVVDKMEDYDFHGDYPLINGVNDYRNGRYNVYIARNPAEGEGEKYGWYISTEESLKIYEEQFLPKAVPFAAFTREEEYPALYYQWNPFDEDWWYDGGRYSGEGYGRAAYWLEEAANDRPNELLREAVEHSGLAMERKEYPWTEETKKNVTETMRCPVADYYYESEDYAAEYVRGNIIFYRKPLFVEDQGTPRLSLVYGKKLDWETIWNWNAKEVPPAICYREVLAEFERLWKQQDWPEDEDGYLEGYGQYAGDYYVNAWCRRKDKEQYRLCYSLVDLSGEGIDELLVGFQYEDTEGETVDILQAVFTCQGGTVTNIFDWENIGGPYWRLCEGNILEISRPVYGYGDYCFYRLRPYGDEAEMVDTFGYQGHAGEDGQMVYEYYNSREEPITEEEFQEKLKPFGPVEIEWQPLEGFAGEEDGR